MIVFEHILTVFGSRQSKRVQMASPIQVSIVTSGRRTDAGRAVWFRSEDWLHVPLYKKLTDRLPDEQIRHDMNADCVQTLVAIYGQEAFAGVCIEFVDQFMLQVPTGTKLVDASCNKGIHRSDTFGKTVAEMLNTIEDPQLFNGRVFNCQVFSMQWYTREDAINKHIDSAVDWSNCDEPHIMPGGANRSRDRSVLFAYAATAQRRGAQQNFDKIWNYVDAVNSRFLELAQAKAAAASCRSQIRERCRSRSLLRKAPPVQRGSEVRPPLLTVNPLPLPLPPFPPAPPNVPAGPLPAFSQTLPSEHVGIHPPRPPLPPTPARQVALLHATPKSTSAASSSSATPAAAYAAPPVAPAAPAAPPTPPAVPWANIRCDSDMAVCWRDVLTQQGVDETAQMGLFGLAQCGPKGRSAAFGILAKLMKKQSDGEVVQNVSGFVWKCVKNTWDNSDWR